MPDDISNDSNDSNVIDSVFNDVGSNAEPANAQPTSDPQPAEGGASDPQASNPPQPKTDPQPSTPAGKTPSAPSLTADDIANATTKALENLSRANAQAQEANKPMSEAEFNKLFNRVPVQAKVLEAILNPDVPMVNKVQALQMVLDQNANHAVARANYLIQAAVQQAVRNYQAQLAPIMSNYSAQAAKKSVEDFSAMFPGFDTKAHKDILGAAVVAVQKELQGMSAEAQKALTKDQVYSKVAEKAANILKQVNPNFDPKVKAGGGTQASAGASNVPSATARSFPTAAKVNTNPQAKATDAIDALFEESDY